MKYGIKYATVLNQNSKRSEIPRNVLTEVQNAFNFSPLTYKPVMPHAVNCKDDVPLNSSTVTINKVVHMRTQLRQLNSCQKTIS